MQKLVLDYLRVRIRTGFTNTLCKLEPNRNLATITKDLLLDTDHEEMTFIHVELSPITGH